MKLARIMVMAGCLACGMGQMIRAEAGQKPFTPAAGTNTIVRTPPRPPLAKSPVASFRELLALDSSHRDEWLTNRPVEVRDRILAKLREYTGLPPEERELRLRATELRWYLAPLLASPVTNQAALLERVPTDLRPLITARLLLWSITPPQLRQQLLSDDRNLRLYLQLEASTPDQQESLLQAQSPAQRKELEAGFARWRGLSAADRQKSLDRVNRFFDLTAAEKARVLANFSPAERRQMEQTLVAFEKLPPEKRARCVRAFGKFASLTPEQRTDFLKNAERWQAMTPAERESFRRLVQVAPVLPPLPPKLNLPPRPGTAAAVATNGR